MRKILTASLTALALTTGASAAPRHAPVVVNTPDSDGLPLLSDAEFVGSNVRTFTNTRGARSFSVPLTGVPTYGPLRYGVFAEDAPDLIAVRTREPLPTILVNPYEEINDRTRDEIRRQFPYARRVDTITDDLRLAQRQFLKDSGLILNVRTFGGSKQNAPAPRGSAPAAPATRVIGPDEEVQATSTRVIRADIEAANEEAEIPEAAAVHEDAPAPAADDQSPE